MDFGTVFIASQVQRTFTVSNTGSSDLRVSSVAISGASAKNFSINPAVGQAVIAAGNSLKFTVTYAPDAERMDKAVISIASDDPLTSQFTFPVQGAGKLAIPNVVLQGNGLTIVNGDITPDAADNTEFGTVRVSGLKSGRFSINNNGTASLVVSAVAITGQNPSDFSLIDAPKVPDTIATGGRRDFTIRFAPSAKGLRSARVTVQTNSKENASYEFAIRGTGEEVINSVDDDAVTVMLIPNPADQVVRLRSASGFADIRNISVVDLNGTTVFSMPVSAGGSSDPMPEISTSGLTSGVYYVVLEGTASRMVLKMTVLH